MSTPFLSPGLLQLLSFVRVVEAGSFTEAARRAGTSTSAMSKAIGRFERAHGIRLLHRTTHSIALTDEGDQLLEEGRALSESLERVEASLAGLATRSAAGRVRITAPTSFARACIMPELPSFLRANPDIRLEVQFGNEIADLAADGIDLAIRSGRLDGLPGHHVRRLFMFPWIACASPQYLEGRKPLDTPHDLAGYDHVGFRNKATGQILSWRFAGQNGARSFRLTPNAKHIFDDAEAAWSMVREGFGIGWGPAWLGLDDLKSGRVVEVLRPWRIEQEPLSMVRLASRHAPKRTLLAMDFLAALPLSWPA